LSFLRGLKNSVAFLTILPVGMDKDGLSKAAAYMPIFPLIDAAVGFLVGVVVWGLEFVFPRLIAATIGLGLLLLLNGVQHFDGLLDFGDGVMFHGNRAGKLRVMRDPTTGAGGFALGFIVLSTAILGIATLPLGFIIVGVIVAETAASFSIVFLTSISKPAHRGMGSIFVDAMHNRRGLQIGVSLVVLLAISLLSLRLIGLVVAAGAIVTAAIMAQISSRHFGGITGDVMGATNEISRVISLLLILVFLR